MKTKIILTIVFLFSIIYMPLCAATYNINESQTISYTTTYTNNLNDEWNVVSTVTNKPLTITYTINTEAVWDVVSIYSVDNSGGLTNLISLSGQQSGTISTVLPNGKAKIVFHTDGSVCYGGIYTGINISFSTDVNATTSTNNYVSANAIVNGNMGIGIYNPLEKLHINGAIRGNSAGGAVKMKSQWGYVEVGPQNQYFAHFYTDINKFYFNKPIYIDSGELSAYNTNNLSLQTGGTTRMTILNNNGYVGIGTPNPQYLLDVKGTIRATEVKIENVTNFADFVFQPEYQLPTLSSVDNFIQANRHLPNIPSAAEVKENGMSLVEMQVKLLQKIEELTLYVIEQQKEINLLKQGQK